MIAVCLAFYSPCDYELPKEHLARTLDWLAGEGVLAVLCQVVKPGQAPQPVPSGIRSAVYESSDAIFYKECLWNLSTTLVPEADRFVFLDTDLHFSRDDVIEATEGILDRVDVCQPFETAGWLDRDGKIFQARKSAAYAIAKSMEPAGGRFHPGFSWAMTRYAYNRLGGFFDRHPLGGGDIAFTYSLDEKWVNVDLRAKNPRDAHFATTPAYETYRRNGVACRLKVGYLPHTEVYHHWHGEVVHRQYCSRGTYCPLQPGQEFPLVRRTDGLLAWRSTAISARVAEYFASRREDG